MLARFAQIPQVSIYSSNTLMNNFYMPTLRFQSTNTKKLIKNLQNEYKYETENYTVDEKLQNFIKEQKLKIAETANNVVVKVQKQIAQDNYMEILFRANPPVHEENDQEKEGKQQEENQAQPQFMEFQANIVKQQNNTALACFVSAVDGEIQIQQIQFVPEVKEILDEKLYQGPEFETLDQDLQNSIAEFLQACGLTQNMVQFLESYSQDKEQRLYMEWLKNVEEFVSK